MAVRITAEIAQAAANQFYSQSSYFPLVNIYDIWTSGSFQTGSIYCVGYNPIHPTGSTFNYRYTLTQSGLIYDYNAPVYNLFVPGGINSNGTIKCNYLTVSYGSYFDTISTVHLNVDYINGTASTNFGNIHTDYIYTFNPSQYFQISTTQSSVAFTWSVFPYYLNPLSQYYTLSYADYPSLTVWTQYQTGTLSATSRSIALPQVSRSVRLQVNCTDKAGSMSYGQYGYAYFRNYDYYGVSSNTTVDSALLNSLAEKSLAADYIKTVSVTANSGLYIYYGCPTRFTSSRLPRFTIFSIQGGFINVGQFDMPSYNENYTVYRSTHSGLGLTDVTILENDLLELSQIGVIQVSDSGSSGVSVHNDLTSIQGGDALNRWHLDQAQYDNLTNTNVTFSGISSSIITVSSITGLSYINGTASSLFGGGGNSWKTLYMLTGSIASMVLYSIYTTSVKHIVSNFEYLSVYINGDMLLNSKSGISAWLYTSGSSNSFIKFRSAMPSTGWYLTYIYNGGSST